MQISLSQEEANPLALVSRIIILKFKWESLVFGKDLCKDSKTHQWARFRVHAGLSLISDPEVYKANHSTVQARAGSYEGSLQKRNMRFSPNRRLSLPPPSYAYCDNFVEEDMMYDVFYMTAMVGARKGIAQCLYPIHSLYQRMARYYQ